MKSEEKQIEEIAIRLYDAVNNKGLVLVPNPYSLVGWSKIAEELLKHYQIVDKDSVVLTKEKFWELSDKFSKKELDDISQFRVDKAVKETIEKFLIKGKQLVEKWLSRDDEKVGFIFDFEQFIREQFGVGVREDNR